MKKFIRLCIIVYLLTPLLAFADGGLFIPYRPDIYMEETRQQAFIFYEDGIETLVLSTGFKGDAQDFAWVVPTPSKPEVEKGSKQIFEELERITKHSYSADGYLGGAALGLGSSGGPMADKQSVRVLETKKIEYYQIDILEADDTDALSKWLTKNGYNFPQSEAYVLNDYIQNNWYFIAVKIDTTAKQSEKVNLDVEEGSATPLKIIFETENIVYPMKISSIQPEVVERQGAYITSGIVGKAAVIPNNTYLIAQINHINHVLPYQIINGLEVSFYFKTDQKSLIGTNYTLLTLGDDVVVGFHAFGMRVQLKDQIWTTESADYTKKQLVDGWNHVQVMTGFGEVPKLFLNGLEVELLDLTRPEITQVQTSNLSFNLPDTLSLGDSQKRLNNPEILFDEVEMHTDNNCPDCSQFSLISSFDDRLTASFSFNNPSTSSSLVTYSPVSLEGSAQVDRSSRQEYIPVELYIITNHRQEVSGFSTVYAGWIRKKEIEKLGYNINGDSLIEPEKRRYFLTKLTRSMRQADMTEDLFARKAGTDDLVNSTSYKYFDASQGVLWLIVISVFITCLLLFILVRWSFFQKDKSINKQE